MRTIRELALSELVPNSAAEKTLRVAGSHVEEEEDGPIYVKFKERPCFNIASPLCLPWLLQRVCCLRCCCLRPRVMPSIPGGVCCCLPRRNNRLCGSVEREYLYCDPILRLPSVDAALKKKITDQIKNCLSEATSGNHFMGWEANPANYRSENFLWCLTYEQPLTKANTRSDNRKFRILIAREGLVEFAIKHDPWFVFNKKRADMYTKYCDRRWFHLRVMGHVHAAKNTLRQEGAALHAKYPVVEDCVDGPPRVYRNLVNGDPDEARRRHEEHAREVRWLDTFFVDRISVVTPRGHPSYDREAKRPWEDKAWVARVDTLQRAFDQGKARSQQVPKRSQNLAASPNGRSSERRSGARSK
jgi:hypothetical protein